MKADVTPTDERKKEALEWATKFFESQAAFLTREGSAPKLPEIARNSAAAWLALPPEYREPLLVQLIRCSLIDGDGYCTMILIELVTIFIAMDRPLPDLLKWFTHIRLRYPDVKWRTETETSGEERTAVGELIKRKPGPRADEWMMRNWAIVYAIEHIVKKWAFQATRNSVTKDLAKYPSAASIVREAIRFGAERKLTEAAVNKIWNENRFDFSPEMQLAAISRLKG